MKYKVGDIVQILPRTLLYIYAIDKDQEEKKYKTIVIRSRSLRDIGNVGFVEIEHEKYLTLWKKYK